MYFYALTAHFGQWLEVVRRAHIRQWQVAAGLIYGQVKNSYRRRKLARVTHVMRLGTEAALKVVLQGLGHSGRLNTAFIERVNLTVRHGIAALARRSWATSQQASQLLAHLSGGERTIILCVLTITPRGARAATRARWQTGGATLPTPYESSGSRENHRRWTAREVLSYHCQGYRLRTAEAR